MTDRVKQELNNYVKHISSIEGVLEIYLFGSYVYGNPTANSDLDLMVIVKDHLCPIRTAFTINKALFRQKQLPSDIAVNRISDFTKASEESLFQRTIKEKGVVLYATP
ncbi:MAG: nucleotidyltransferase domain-containing protein [Defluviitaleaceae bacterium]|nr:nucleotidyltransferase domain-containing protein [Defluviitaleaceae bacterium]MCL2274638.1 nucleotidyltransferase domain-containing protein [Defluviitaleaceae bacterium]